jgi:undecaprenyl diphosphate synthase
MPDSEKSLIPKHVGYVVDGNRRWAKKHGLPYYEGHLAGYNALKDVLIATVEAGVEYMSAYIFSTENWKRSADEVKRLMAITLKLLTTDVAMFNEYNVKLRVIGSREGISDKILKAMASAEAATENNTGGTLALCFNYGGQQEIVDAIKKIVHSKTKEDDVTTELVTENLYVPEVPPIDVIVRTSGEKRISNFMLWRAAYSEFIFLDQMWPEMTKDDVTAIMKEYSRRQRRFGS